MCSAWISSKKFECVLPLKTPLYHHNFLDTLKIASYKLGDNLSLLEVPSFRCFYCKFWNVSVGWFTQYFLLLDSSEFIFFLLLHVFQYFLFKVNVLSLNFLVIMCKHIYFKNSIIPTQVSRYFENCFIQAWR